MGQDIIFTSKLGCEFKESLEELLFFNPQQNKVFTEIIGSINKYGAPSIIESGSLLRIKLERLQEAQTLFAIDDRSNLLVGLVIYVRVPLHLDSIVALHMAIDHEYTLSGMFSRKHVAYNMIEELRRIGGKIKGVKTVNLIYGRGGVKRLCVY